MKQYEFLGNFSAVDPAYSRGMDCHECEVSWVGCWDNFECPRCGKGELPNSDFKEAIKKLEEYRTVSTFEHAKIGDRVWNQTWGWGEIVNIDWDAEYPIDVDFEGHAGCFNLNGFQYGAKYPDIYWEEPETKYPVIKPEPEIDWSKVPPYTKVLVRNREGDSWCLHDFAVYLEQSSFPFMCVSGAVWKYCKLNDNAELKQEWVKK